MVVGRRLGYSALQVLLLMVGKRWQAGRVSFLHPAEPRQVRHVGKVRTMVGTAEQKQQ